MNDSPEEIAERQADERQREVVGELDALYSVMSDVRLLLTALVRIHAHACPRQGNGNDCFQCGALADEVTKPDEGCEHTGGAP